MYVRGWEWGLLLLSNMFQLEKELLQTNNAFIDGVRFVGS